jgi:hypothetical protein
MSWHPASPYSHSVLAAGSTQSRHAARAPLHWGGLPVSLAIWPLPLLVGHVPAGISILHISGVAYLIEKYWEENLENDFIDFSLYMGVFMKFSTGTIERGQTTCFPSSSRVRRSTISVPLTPEACGMGQFLKLTLPTA